MIMNTVLTSRRPESNFDVYNSYFRLKYLSSLLVAGIYVVYNSLIIHFLYSLARWILPVCFLLFSVCLLALLCTISILLQVRIIHFCMDFLCKHKQNRGKRNIFMSSYPMSLSFLWESWNQRGKCLSQWVWTDFLIQIRKMALEGCV